MKDFDLFVEKLFSKSITFQKHFLCTIGYTKSEIQNTKSKLSEIYFLTLLLTKSYLFIYLSYLIENYISLSSYGDSLTKESRKN